MTILEGMKIRHLFCDGGMGNLLQAQGLKPGELPGTWSLTRRDALISIHQSYLKASVDVTTTNTFGANRLKFKDNLEFIVAAAMRNARTAVREAGHGYVVLDPGPTGRLLKSLGDLDLEDVVKLYKEVVSTDARAGADLVLTETMSDNYGLKAVVLTAREAGLRPDIRERLPVSTTAMFDKKGKLLTGGNMESTVVLLEGLRMGALGINCGLGPVQMRDILEEILRVSSPPVLVSPSAGLPGSENGKTVYDTDAEGFALVMEEIAAMDTVVVEGCCGTTPEHVRLMTQRCKDTLVVWPEKKHHTVISSYAKAVTADCKTITIGERINPIGKSKSKQALRDRSLEYALKEGVSQQDNGADALDVNVRLPEIHKPFITGGTVRELQAVIDLPFQINTSDMETMECAMRICNEKPLINSVNGKEEPVSCIFPLMVKHGGVAVGLCLDESGIPDTADGRLAVGKKIIEQAAVYEIGLEDIILDGLCMTVSPDSKGALTALEVLQCIRGELGVGTVLGVFNISFRLSRRETINAVFLVMAMECGLGAAITNPNSEAMMRVYYSFNALMDQDPQCSQYISVYSGQSADLGQIIGKSGSQNGIKADNHFDSGEDQGEGSQGLAPTTVTERGLKEVTHNAVTELLKGREPLDIINNEMIPALDRVGKGFGKGTVFLPQLPVSTKVAKAAFEVIKAVMDGSEQIQEKRGTTILATMKGDIYNTGKNIVKVLLGNYSYEVVDPGRDVPSRVIVKGAAERQIAPVGLSTLMTTTMPSTEETIRQPRATSVTVEAMVGGAVLTEDCVRTIGADIYRRDAMASINYAEQIFGA